MNLHPRTLAVLAIVCLVPASAFACSVPVFRYALEHWQPDPYRVSLYHDQDLSDADRKLISYLRSQEEAGANVELQIIDLRESLEPQDQARWDALSEKTTPRMIVHLPDRASARIGAGDAPVDSALWNEEQMQQLLRSPAREEIGRRLVAGEVVWVFLDSGNPEVDDPLYETLNEQLGINQQTLKLPAIEEDDLDELAADPSDLKIRFSSLRISRDDPAEKWFVEMLLSVESDLRDPEIVEQPMVFPVFGRGRALYALVGQGIAEDTIRQAGAFLTGACQCTVKAENPGVDLLIPLRWDEFIEKSEPEEVELALVGLGGGLPISDDGAVETTDQPTASRPTDSVAADDDRAESDATGLPQLPADDDGRTRSVFSLPLVVLLVIGAVVGLLGTSILRRQ